MAPRAHIPNTYPALQDMCQSTPLVDHLTGEPCA
jgi:hypothetical protein